MADVVHNQQHGEEGVNSLSSRGLSLAETALALELEEVKRLVEQEGRPIGEADPLTGDTALHAAATRGRVTVADYLLQRGADVNCRNASGSTPLHKALAAGHAAVADLLVKHGADGDARNSAGLLPEDYTRQRALRQLAQGRSAVEVRVPVPRHLRGLVIGQGGRTLKRISTASGADATFPLPSPATNNRNSATPAQVDIDGLILRGRPEAVEKARTLVLEILAKRKEDDTVAVQPLPKSN